VVVGICRELYAVLPADLGIDLQSAAARMPYPCFTLAVEADRMWSFVLRTSNKQWIGIALDAKTAKSSHSMSATVAESARQLLEENTDVAGNTLPFITDLYDSYVDVIPEKNNMSVTRAPA